MPFPSLVKRWPSRYNKAQVSIISRTLQGYKLIRYSDGTSELFNLKDDPDEQNPLIDPEIQSVIEDELDAYLKQLPHRVLENPKKMKLKSLGYVN